MTPAAKPQGKDFFTGATTTLREPRDDPVVPEEPREVRCAMRRVRPEREAVRPGGRAGAGVRGGRAGAERARPALGSERAAPVFRGPEPPESRCVRG